MFLPPSKLLENYLLASAKGYAKNLCSILERMVEHNLEATEIVDSDRFGIAIIWENGFNQTHRIEMHCSGSNAFVMCVATDSADPTWKKEWIVKEYSVFTETSPGVSLVLTIDETLEYIRHFIWANHSV